MSLAIVRDDGVRVSPLSVLFARRRRVAHSGDDAQAAAEPLILELSPQRCAVSLTGPRNRFPPQPSHLVARLFPKPGQTQPSKKWSYVKAINADGAPGLIGAGFYPE